MTFPQDASYDGEFHRLICRRPGVNLVRAALEVARDTDPTISPDQCEAWLDQRAEEVRGPVALADSESEALAALGACLCGRHQLTGDVRAYDTANGSFPHQIIANHRGIPLGLSLLYIDVARRVGLELSGVAAPQHFLTRYESADGAMYVDPYHCGRVLDQTACLLFFERLTGHPACNWQTHLRPADDRTVMVRFLNNLKAVHVRQGDWCAAWFVQHRLLALRPADYEERRDLAFISLRAGRPGQAIDLLESCLACGPEQDRVTLQAQLRQAQSQLCRMN